MAAAILRHRDLPNVEVRSGGVFANDGDAASRHAGNVLAQNGIAKEHTAKRITEADIAWATLVLTMTKSHKQLVMQQFPEFAAKIFTLKEFVSNDELDVIDPFGGNENDYKDTFSELSDLIDKLIPKSD